MRIRIIISFVFLLAFAKFNYGQNLKAYNIYNQKGKVVSFENMAKQLATYDVVLFGEHHDNALNHWLQLRTLKVLYQIKGAQLVLGAEMFERDNQKEIDEYLSDTGKAVLSSSLRLWPNFKTDYRPLLSFAQTHQLRFIASNVPRRYASLLAQKGWQALRESLLDHEKEWIVNLPIIVDMKTPGYAEMEEMMKSMHSGVAAQYVAAQALKDATMAESILKNRKDKELFLHFNGDYHSKEYGGIYWYLKKHKKNLKVAVISIAVSDEEDLKLPKDFKPTEFNLVFPDDMTKTH